MSLYGVGIDCVVKKIHHDMKYVILSKPNGAGML